MLDTLLDIKEKEITTRELTKEDLDKVRDIEGFPIGKDEDIIALSRPPYYTACPNPFIEEFIERYGKPYDEETDTYKREPFAADVSEGKYDPMYKIHSYHTKVPHKAIMRYILHYTEPGDIVLDGFCGTGMTGVATQFCLNPDSQFKVKIESEMPYVKWGLRKAILTDLSPVATFISYNYNTPTDIDNINKQAELILEKCKKEYKWMYETFHTDENGERLKNSIGYIKGEINYTAWSDVFICPNCGEEIVFWEVAVDIKNGKVKENFNCNNCSAKLKKKECSRAIKIIRDNRLNKEIKIAKQEPVYINYSVNGKRYEKKVDIYDKELINKISEMDSEYWYPIDRLPDGYNTMQPIKSHGLSYTNLFYTKRNLFVLSKFRELAGSSSTLLFCLTKVANHITKQYRLTYMNGCWGAGGGPMSGTLYIPSLQKELNILTFLDEAIKTQTMRIKEKNDNVCISTQSTTNLEIPSNSIDYIFTDPPFGSNLNYSELSYLWESWLRVKTNNKNEAIVNTFQNKGVFEYQELMLKCFKEYYRVLKPNRWITIEFHNSKNSIWNSIQDALAKAGFIIADVRTLDKKHNSFMQITSSSIVKQDLVISAYKPKEGFVKRFIKNIGSDEVVWEFIRCHLENLPISVIGINGKLERIREREPYLLYDRMIAYHIVNDIAIPISAVEFYKKLSEKFIERDGMYFLQEQVNKYDNERTQLDIEPIQFSFLVSDEKNAIAWLYKYLEVPKTYGEIQPEFMQELNIIKHEKMPELMELLQENFLKDDEGKWYIPDITKSGDLIKLREKRLVKEFEEYLKGKGKLKVFRTEAVRAGFAKLWKEKDYKNIVKVAERLPESVIQEDDKLLMYYDISLSRIE